MKLDKYVLAEIISIIQSGLMGQKDVSEELRNLDLCQNKDLLCLTDDYLAVRGRKNPYSEE